MMIFFQLSSAEDTMDPKLKRVHLKQEVGDITSTKKNVLLTFTFLRIIF